MTIPRPGRDEYGEWYAGYVAAVPEGDVQHLLATQIDETAAALAAVSESKAGFRYAPGKWSIREVTGHLADAERIFAYRALRFARGDEAPLPGFDENRYVEESGFDARTLASLVGELRDVRQATMSLFDGLAPDVFERRGTASGAVMSVRALVYVIVGHQQHHLGVLRERYLSKL
jgi:uncharacterized damage-inducible protein DinB